MVLALLTRGSYVSELAGRALLSLRKGDRVLHYAFEGAPALTGPKTRRGFFPKPLRQLRTDGDPRNPVPPSARHALHLRIAQAAELVERGTAPPNQAFDHSYSSSLEMNASPRHAEPALYRSIRLNGLYRHSSIAVAICRKSTQGNGHSERPEGTSICIHQPASMVPSCGCGLTGIPPIRYRTRSLPAASRLRIVSLNPDVWCDW